MLPLRFQGSPHIHRWECFLVFENFFFKTPFPGQISVPTSFASLFVFYVFSYLLSKTMGAWCPLPAFRSCFVEFAQSSMFFDEFMGEKLVSLSYSKAILEPPSR